MSTGCGPSPPRETISKKKESPKREMIELNNLNQITSPQDPSSKLQKRSVSVGPSPPREEKQQANVNNSSQFSNYVDPSVANNRIQKHSVSVGPSPPRESIATHSISIGPSPPREGSTALNRNAPTSSPLKDVLGNRGATISKHTSSTGTSPPPQSISTQVILFF